MTIHNGTKSTRTSFALYGKLSDGASINGISGNVFICVGAITVKSSDLLPGETAAGNQTFAAGTITYTCGQDLTLSNNYLAWTDAAGDTKTRCDEFSKATSCANIAPKCGQAASITIVGPLVGKATPTNVLCFGGTTGSVDLTPSGGKAPYTFLWSNGAKTEDISGLSAGTYTCTITDANKCTFPVSATVGGPSAALSLTASGTPVKCFGGSDGKIDGTVSGGTAPYSVTLKKGGVVQGSAQTVTTSGGSYSFTGLAAGTDYSVSATDNNGTTGGCADSKTASVGGPSAALSLTASGTPVKCFGGSDGKIDGTVSGGTAPYSVTLKKGGVVQGSAQTVTTSGGSYSFTGLAAGTDYSVSATDNNGTTGGCADSKTASVGGPSAALSLTASGTAATCAGSADGKIGGTVSGGTAPYSVTLKKGGVVQGSAQTVTTSGGSYSFTGLAAGTDYSVSATDNNGTTGGCADSKTATVADGATPAAPTVCIVLPSLCDKSLTGFKISFTGTLATGDQYSIDDGKTWFTTSVFCNVAAGSNPIMRVKNSKGCISDPTACTSSNVSICSSDPVCPVTNNLTSTSQSRQQIYDVEINLDPVTKVTAAPNPYNDRIRFSLKSSVSGQGSLELYNMLGQRLKTVFQGHVNAGQVQTIEYTVPGPQRGNMIYLFRVGDAQTTGKLIGLKK